MVSARNGINVERYFSLCMISVPFCSPCLATEAPNANCSGIIAVEVILWDLSEAGSHMMLGSEKGPTVTC